MVINYVGKSTLYWSMIYLAIKLAEAVASNNDLYFPNVLVGGIIFSVVLGGIIPFIHEWLHKIAYKVIHLDAKISIHLGDGLWFVYDESEYTYSKSQMIFIVMAPFAITIVPVMLFFLISNPFFQALFVMIGMINLLGMLGKVSWLKKVHLFNHDAPQGDLMHIWMILFKDNKGTQYKFQEGAILKRF